MGQSPTPPSRFRYSRLVLACLGAFAATIAPAHSHADIYRTERPDGVVELNSRKTPGAKLVAKDKATQVFLPADTSPERYTLRDLPLGAVGPAVGQHPLVDLGGVRSRELDLGVVPVQDRDPEPKLLPATAVEGVRHRAFLPSVA